LARLVVNKHLAFFESAEPFSPAPEGDILAAGFSRIADYASFTLYEGPASAVAGLIDLLKNEEYEASVPTDLDHIHLLGHEIDADTGVASPPYPASPFAKTGASGLYLLALRGYPLQAWLDELQGAGINIIEPLPPSAYIVSGDRQKVEGLKNSTAFVRGAFPMLPLIKTEPVTEFSSGKDAYRRVVINAFETSATIQDFLASVADGGAVTAFRDTNTRIRYAASLGDLDIATLSNFESVYAISPVSEPEISSERQASILTQAIGTGSITLPSTATNYGGWLNGKSITDFANTKVALLDNGFDDLSQGNQQDFVLGGASTVITSSGTTIFNQTTDPNTDGRRQGTHGTMTASVITAWEVATDSCPTICREDSQGYHYAYGVAPTVATAMDKYLGVGCSSFPVNNCDPYTRLQSALTALSVWGPNVINSSWNNGVTNMPIGNNGQCIYDMSSQLIDQNSRTILHVISAGNLPDSAPQPPLTGCSTVRSPATAKNAIAVGAAENYTINTASSLWINTSGGSYGDICPYNYYPSTQDARNIWAQSAGQASGTLYKPDLVEPGLRITGPVSRDTTWTDPGVFCDSNYAIYNGIKYRMSAGTSFAAPVVTGAAAVVRKWYANITMNPSANPSPAETKAILINGARDLFGGVVRQVTADNTNPSGTAFLHIPDAHQGLGMVSFGRLLDSSANHYWADQPIALITSAPTWAPACNTVVAGNKETRITMAYTDRASVTLNGSSGALVNKLDLAVCLNGGFLCWWGDHWTTIGTTQSSSPTQSFPDGINNVKEVVMPANTFTTGQQVCMQVTATVLMGDGINPNGNTLQQDFAIFGTNIH
jgi:hypothetical protein